MLPKFTRVQTKEKVIVAYRDSSNWLHTSQGMCSGGSGVCKLLDVGDVGSVETWARTGALGTIFLTNRRIIFESLDGDIVELHLHEDIKSTEGKDGKDVWAGWDHGLLRINKIDGNYVEYVLYCGKKFSDRANQMLERVKAERARLEGERMENEAYTKEEDLDNAGAIKIWESLGNRSEAKRIRLKMREEEKVKVDQTVVHGDYVDDRDTIIKDSVISKSSIGAGGKSKAEQIGEIKELLDSGAIDDAEFKQMKKEILGK